MPNADYDQEWCESPDLSHHAHAALQAIVDDPGATRPHVTQARILLNADAAQGGMAIKQLARAAGAPPELIREVLRNPIATLLGLREYTSRRNLLPGKGRPAIPRIRLAPNADAVLRRLAADSAGGGWRAGRARVLLEAAHLPGPLKLRRLARATGVSYGTVRSVIHGHVRILRELLSFCDRVGITHGPDAPLPAGQATGRPSPQQSAPQG